MDEPAQPTRFPTHYVVLALLAWGVLTFGHRVGLDQAAALFAWARRPGTLTDEGGAAGMRVFEGGMAVLFGLIAALIVARVVLAARGKSRADVADAFVPWVA